MANYGTDPFSSCDINYSIYDVTNSVYFLENQTYTWTGTALNTNENIDIIIGSFTSEHSVTYSITVTSDLVGDTNTSDNQATVVVATIPVYSIPYYQEFETYLPTGWTEAKGLLASPTTLRGTTSNWLADGFANNGGTGSAGINIYFDDKEEWLFTPFIDLGGMGHGALLEFDLALTNYGNSNPPESIGEDDKFAVVISTDGGQTWTITNTLQMWDNTTTPSYGDISTIGETIIIDLSAYSGVIQIGFYGESTESNADNDLFVDNVIIAVPPTNDASITEVVSPLDNFWAGTTDVTVNLANYGIDPFSACDINYSVYDVTNSAFILENQIYNWSGVALNTDENIDITIGNFTSEGTTTYSITVTSDLTDDEYLDNNQANTVVSTLAGYDASITEIVSPIDNFIPAVTDIIVNFKNIGTYTITTCDINYSVYDITNSTYLFENQVYTWTGTLANEAETEVTLNNFIAETMVTYSLVVSSLLVDDENTNNNEVTVEVTTASIYPIPYQQDFESYLPTDWTEAKGLLDNPVVFTGTSSEWTSDGFANNGSTGSAGINIYGTNRKDWLFTPFIDLGDMGHGAVLKFDLALTDWNNSGVPDEVGEDDKFAVIISIDGGQTWITTNTLQMWDNTTTPAYGDISTTGEKITLDLSAYSGVIQLGFYGESTVYNEDNDLFVDNLIIETSLTYTVTFYVHDQFNDALEGATVEISGQSENTNQYGKAYLHLPEGEASYSVTYGSDIVTGTYLVTTESDQFVNIEVVISNINEINSEINIFPNPSKGEFTVSLDGTYSFQLIDLTGKIILEQNITDSEEIKINNSGIYTLRLTNETGVFNYKIIVE